MFVYYCFTIIIYFIVAASAVVSALMDIALKKEPRRLDHLKFLITSHLESLNLSSLKEENTETAVQLLSTAVIRNSVGLNQSIHFR